MSQVPHKLLRRTFLGSLGAAATLPFLRSFPLRAQEGDGPVPKVLFVAFPNGPLVGDDGSNDYDGWRPPGYDGSDTVLPEMLHGIFEPLTPHRDRLLFLEGLSYLEPSNPHRATTSLLTGRKRKVNPGDDLKEYTSTGPSIDHVLQEELGTQKLNTAYRIQGYASVGESYWSYSGEGARITPIQDPVDTYSLVFGEGLDEGLAQQVLTRRTSVLDVIAGDIEAMKARVPAVDRPRLEEHLQSVRDLELQLIATAESGCQSPDPLAGYAHLQAANAPRVFRDHAAVITQAFACGWSRVATLHLGSFGGDALPMQWPDLDIETNYTEHGICHAFHGIEGVGGPAISQADGLSLGLAKERAFSTMFKEILDGLETTTDVDGSPLLDNTLVGWSNALAKGNSHTSYPVPYVLAGSAGGYFETGRFLDYGDESANRLLVSVCNAMGLPEVTTYGDMDPGSGPVEGLA